MQIDQAKQEAQEKRERLIQVTGGPMPYEQFTLERFEKISGNEEALSFAKDFDPDEMNLFLWGCCGGGKTHLSTAIARMQAEKGVRVSRQTVAEFLRNFRALEGYVEQEKIAIYARVPMLIWDDLGRGNISDFGLDILCEIADKRLMNYRRGLIVTSNFSPEQLVSKFQDDRLVSRLVGMCGVAHMEGPKEWHGDWRIKLAVAPSGPVSIRESNGPVR
jgi:DNA replication protein DnaC